jgi:hypothetical protein
MQWLVANGPMQTTAAFAKVAVSTIKTMLEVKTITQMKIFEWGWSGDASAAATPGNVELIETGSVFATVTASVTADITRWDAEALLFGDPLSTYFSASGVNATGYTASVEGSITAVRNLAGPQLEPPTNQLIQQFPLGYRPLVQPAVSQRIRGTFGTSVNVYCYELLESQ